MPVAIRVENLSKIYRLGEVGTGTLSQDVHRWWVTKVLRKEDPFLKIGQANQRDVKAESDIVYSLNDINLEVQQGDTIGIIGRNGAGKSTLLKVMTRVTSPSTGKIFVNGRIASLLEVGTGFHPELTGRENIFLNGAILGMRKREILQQLDEIIAFSGVERYIDTPVKRYSSGMYVRLAFAVAAHLRSEILIVDEVLAVGDAEFQKKCLQKMGEVSNGEGRTVLFVSHNMASVEKLCKRGLLLKDGFVDYEGDIKSTIERYLSTSNQLISTHKVWANEKDAPGNENIRILSIQLKPTEGDMITVGIGLQFDFKIRNYRKDTRIGFNLRILTQSDLLLFTTAKLLADRDSIDGIYTLSMVIPHPLLNQGVYKLKIFFGEFGTIIADLDEDLFVFEVLPKILDNGINPDKLHGITLPGIYFNVTHSEII